ncbi:hypothetical protein PCORN_09942 [Listeria cornellensis FSL F6-0969]|uniref:General stress protein n=1 Tax=Listeria cornellensis FSL F6-0969 TaxID=1265820 RepID=W7BRV7_9LIST|nr:hypothetical protein PCORN_09942 [Listeria cornellensis FSL F6-0969]
MSGKDGINVKDFLIGGLIGGIVGSVTALLLAPKSGKELRGDLNEHVDVMKEKGSQWKDVAYEKGIEIGNVAKDKKRCPC